MRETTLLRRVLKIFGIAALTILFLACPEEFDEKIPIEEQQDKAEVLFSVTDNLSRTVLPQVSLDDVASYTLLGGLSGNAETELTTFTGSGTSVFLDLGTWNFTLKAYKSSGELILQGQVQNKQINKGTNPVSFSMDAIKSGTGSIQITLNFPGTAGITKITASGDVASENFTSISGGTFVYTKTAVAAGEYLINFELFRGDISETVVSELVVVRSNLTSSKTITLVGDDLKPLLTGTVNIIGTVVVGETLMADTGALNGTGAISYQWKRGGTDIGTANTYTVQAADVGGTITVTVTRVGYIGEVISSPTAAVPALITVTFSNLTQDGSDNAQTTTVLTLSFSSAITNLSANDITISHSVSGQTIVKGVLTASGSTYTLPISGFSVGGTLTVAVAKPGYTISSSSRTVTIYCFSPPLTGTVSITGTLQTNQRLTAVTTNLNGNGTITYQWRRGTTSVGSNSDTYTVQSADLNTTFTLIVTRAGYSGNVVSPSMLTGTVSISGTAQVGQTLTAVTTSLSGSGDIFYQWSKSGTAISGATGSTYIIQSADANSTINVTVTRAGNSGYVTSSSTTAVTLPALTGSVSITGTVQVGQTLTANTSSLSGTGTISYQWNRGGTAISGATSSTYTVVAADLDNTLSVTVTRAGYTGSVTSTSVSVVIVLPFSTTVEGTISGTNTVHRYAVTLDQTGALTLSLTVPTGTTALPNNSVDVKWYNSAGTQISGGASSGFTFPYTETLNNMAVGTYYVEILGRTGVGNTGRYNIRVDYYKDEAEPNNTTATAQQLVPGLTVRGEITSSDTVDMFKYVLTEPGRLTVTATRDTLNEVWVRWYTSDSTMISETDFWGSNKTYSHSMDFEAGTYYIVIEKYTSNTGTYNLRGDFTAAGNNETEPNNTTTNAQLLTISQTVKGFISYQDGTDMYKYVLTQPGRLTLTVTRDTLNEVWVRWYTSDGTMINETDFWGSNTTYSHSMDFEAGTYYIGIVKYTSNTGTYNLSANFTAAGNNETEPNETRQTAQLLTSGQTVKGFISHQDGTDMYRVVLTQSRTFTLTVTRDTLNEVWVRRYDVDGNQLSNTDFWGSNTTYSQSWTLAAGTYYIGIEKYTSNTGTYTLTATW